MPPSRCAPPRPPLQVVEKANKKAKLADKEIDLYHLQDSDPLTAPELTAAVDRLFSGAQQPMADEAVLTGLVGQVGAAVPAGLWVLGCHQLSQLQAYRMFELVSQVSAAVLQHCGHVGVTS
jgi:hypothetical protein